MLATWRGGSSYILQPSFWLLSIQWILGRSNSFSFLKRVWISSFCFQYASLGLLHLPMHILYNWHIFLFLLCRRIDNLFLLPVSSQGDRTSSRVSTVGSFSSISRVGEPVSELPVCCVLLLLDFSICAWNWSYFLGLICSSNAGWLQVPTQECLKQKVPLCNFFLGIPEEGKDRKKQPSHRLPEDEACIIYFITSHFYSSKRIYNFLAPF